MRDTLATDTFERQNTHFQNTFFQVLAHPWRCVPIIRISEQMVNLFVPKPPAYYDSKKHSDVAKKIRQFFENHAIRILGKHFSVRHAWRRRVSSAFYESKT